MTSWIKQLHDNADKGVTKLLVGNKLDLAENSDMRAVTYEEGVALAEKYSTPDSPIKFFETSAKKAINVEEAFMSLTVDVVEKISRQLKKSTGGGGGGGESWYSSWIPSFLRLQ